MTLEEYNKKMRTYSERIENGEDILEEVNDFQYDFMDKVLESYKEKIDTHEKEICYELLEYAVKCSQSGSSIYYADKDEYTDDLEDVIWDELNAYMLDAPECYWENGMFVIDCMFAGFYVPEWDGWYD